jgi:formylglycine-generating enzyme required for sulfatase activity
MKAPILVVILLASALCFAQTPAANQKPLTRNQIIELLKAKMESADLAKAIQERGIDFEPTADDIVTLREAGAQDALLKVVRAAKPRPLTRDRVLQLVVAGVPSPRAVMYIQQRGMDFVPDDEFISTLRVAGADDALIAAVRAAGDAARVNVPIETFCPNAEVYLDGVLQGHTDAQGKFVITAKPGLHAVRVSFPGKKDSEGKVDFHAGSYPMTLPVVDLGPTPGAETTRPIEGMPASGTSAGVAKLNPKDGLKYAWIPPGTFMMGCSPGDSGCDADERPAHQVTISKGFWMGETEVTVGAYQRFATATGAAMPSAPDVNSGWGDEQMPIVNVSWEDAKECCGWAGGRLPTEAEWEYAARAGSTEARHGPIDGIAWYSRNSGGEAHAVAQKRPNAFNCFDMLGNVWEWVTDWYGQNYYVDAPQRDPKGARSGNMRVLRGGSWLVAHAQVRVSNRNGAGPDAQFDYIGFRCVRDVVP